MPPPSKYNDTKFFLIAIALISAFNYYLTYSSIRFNGFLLLTYSIDTIEGWIAWWVVRRVILYLDRKMPYGRKPLTRIVVQVLVTTILGLAVIILLTEIVSWIARGRPALPNFYSFDIFIFVIWFLVINGIYIGLHYYLEHKTSEHLRQEEKKLRAGGFRVKKGKEDILIPFQNIYGFYSEGGFTYLQGNDGSKYLTDQSLDKTAVLLPEEWFFRINRQFLVHRQAVTGFRRAGDGKLEVNALAIGGIPASIPVSRQRAIAFRKWFHPVEEASEG